jgi:hypothetical protein
MKTRCLRLVAIALWSCVVAGCSGDSFDRVALSGTVTCEDMASVNGGILGTPAVGGTGAPNVSAPITDGKFSFPKELGPTAGAYIFEISLLIPGAKPLPGESPEGEVETGPEVAYRKTIEIPAGGSDSLTIELTAADRVDSGEI